MSLDNPSDARIKRQGGKASPCRILLVGFIDQNRWSLIENEIEVEEMHQLIILHHFSQKPNDLRIFIIQCHSNLSKVGMSNFRTHYLDFFALDCKVLMHSPAKITLSTICLPFKKADCSSPMHFGRIRLNLAAIILYMFLYISLQRLIGLHCSNFWLLISFGMGIIVVSLIVFGSLNYLKKYWMIFFISANHTPSFFVKFSTHPNWTWCFLTGQLFHNCPYLIFTRWDCETIILFA